MNNKEKTLTGIGVAAGVGALIYAVDPKGSRRRLALAGDNIRKTLNKVGDTATYASRQAAGLWGKGKTLIPGQKRKRKKDLKLKLFWFKRN